MELNGFFSCLHSKPGPYDGQNDGVTLYILEKIS